MTWPDVLLTFAKILGIVGAYLGLNKLGRSLADDAKKGKNLRIVPMLFLSLAVSAEVVDAVKKSQEAHAKESQNEELKRQLDRMQHPLTMGLTPLYSLRLDDPARSPYVQRLMKWQKRDSMGEPPFPNYSETRAAALLDTTVDTTVFLLEAGKAADGEPDMSFSLTEREIKPAGPSFGLEISSVAYPKDRAKRRIRDSAHYTGGNCDLPSICFSEPKVDFSRVPGRYSNGAIISLPDLVGGQMTIRLCPSPPMSGWETPAERRALEKNFTLKGLAIDFGESHHLDIWVGNPDNNVKIETITEQPVKPGDECREYLYSFPKTLDALTATFKP